jgi:adhesin/invasin
MRAPKRLTLTLLAGSVTAGILILTGFYACDNPDPTGPAASERITLSATDNAILADGVSTSLITAYVYNQAGLPAEGPIYWTTTCGSLDKSSETMSAGVSSVTLTAPNSPCVALVTADAVHAKESIEIECFAVDADTVYVTANPTDIPADGYSTSTISAVVTDARGESVPDGTTVNFSTTGGTLSSTTATTESGRATVTLTSETVPKSVQVSATSGSASNYTWVRFYSTQVGRIDLTANPERDIPADGSSGSIITATVFDISGNPVEDGTIVLFTSTWGNLSSSTETTSKGIANVFLYSTYSPNDDATSIVTAVSGDRSDSVSVHFKRYSGTPGSTPIPTSTPANTSTPSPSPTVTPIKTSTPTPAQSSTPSPTPSTFTATPAPTAMRSMPKWYLGNQ